MTQRYAIHRGNRIVRPLLALLGARAGNSYVEVGADQIAVRMGPLFRHQIARSQIVRVAPRSLPLWIGFGWRFDLRGGCYLVGTHRGVVELSLRDPIRVWRLWPVRRLGFSLHDPDGFLAALARGDGS